MLTSSRSPWVSNFKHPFSPPPPLFKMAEVKADFDKLEKFLKDRKHVEMKELEKKLKEESSLR